MWCSLLNDRFKAEGRDLIIVDTSGRHKQSEALFEEMRAVAAGVEPDLVRVTLRSLQCSAEPHNAWSVAALLLGCARRDPSCVSLQKVPPRVSGNRPVRS